IFYKNSGLFLHSADLVMQNDLLGPKFTSAIKIFRSFVSTLPSNKDYFSRLSVINEYYRIMKDAEHHKESVLAHYDKVIIDLEVMQVNYNNIRKQDFLESWSKLSGFIEAI